MNSYQVSEHPAACESKRHSQAAVWQSVAFCGIVRIVSKLWEATTLMGNARLGFFTAHVEPGCPSWDLMCYESVMSSEIETDLRISLGNIGLGRSQTEMTEGEQSIMTMTSW